MNQLDQARIPFDLTEPEARLVIQALTDTADVIGETESSDARLASALIDRINNEADYEGWVLE